MVTESKPQTMLTIDLTYSDENSSTRQSGLIRAVFKAHSTSLTRPRHQPRLAAYDE